MIKKNNLHIFDICMQTIYMVGLCLKNYPQVVLNGKKNISKFTEEFINNYDEDSDKGYILEVDVKYLKKLHLHSDLPFSPEQMKIDKCKKLVCNLYSKKKYVVQYALNHGLILKKVHRVIQFNQEA